MNCDFEQVLAKNDKELVVDFLHGIHEYFIEVSRVR